MHTVDLAGHGGRPLGEATSISALAADVLARCPDGATLVAGHSLGAVVALQMAIARPDYARGVLIEDPPGLGETGVGEPGSAETVAAGIFAEVTQAWTDSDAAVAADLVAHPRWEPRDAEYAVQSRLQLDPAIASLSPTAHAWDLAALVAACPVPLALIAASGPESELGEPVRSALLKLLPPERVTELPSGHAVHKDHPRRWAELVAAFGETLL